MSKKISTHTASVSSPRRSSNNSPRVYRARGLATRLALRRRFLTMRNKASMPMSQWIVEVRNLAQRLRGIGVSVDDEDVVLVNVNDVFLRSFDQFDVPRLLSFTQGSATYGS